MAESTHRRDHSADFAAFWKLHTAVMQGELREVNRILAREAPVERPSEISYSLLLGAAQRGYRAIVRRLLDTDAERYAENPTLPYDTLRAACEQGHHRVVELLLDAGVTPLTDSPGGPTPLYAAASNHHLPALRLLLETGADAQDLNRAFFGGRYRESGSTTVCCRHRR